MCPITTFPTKACQPIAWAWNSTAKKLGIYSKESIKPLTLGESVELFRGRVVVENP